MSHTDRYGLPLSTNSDAAAAAYRDGVDLMLSAWPGADLAFERAIAADPDFALAHAARARAHMNAAQPTEARAAVATARKLAERNATERERSHVATLAFAAEGQPATALTSALAHLDRWPRDAIILSMPLGAFGLFAFSGMADHNQARVDLCERHAAHYGDDWWFQTYCGWSHTENGNTVLGRDLTQRALDTRRANANAAHALAHAMFEDGSTDAADAFISEWLPSYDRRGTLYGHIYWHQALAALERGDAARALSIFTDQVHPSANQAIPLVATTDGASLLWRLHLSGEDVASAHWDAVSRFGNRAFPEAGVSFADVHLAFLAAATGNREALATRVAALERRLDQGKLAPGPIVPAICRAALAFADNDHAGCVRHLEPVIADLTRIGGSHAQREVVEDMLLVALIKTGATSKALTVLDRRLHHRTATRDLRWRAEAMTAAAHH